jgi:hypothetical protein
VINGMSSDSDDCEIVREEKAPTLTDARAKFRNLISQANILPENNVIAETKKDNFAEGESDGYGDESGSDSEEDENVQIINYDILNIRDKSNPMHKVLLGYVTRILKPEKETIVELKENYELQWKKK